jgi:hypothetical protein
MKAVTTYQATIPTGRIVVDEKGCWVWQGAKSEDGYGIITIREKREYVHRAMYQLFIGPINNNRELDHLCRNRACCNPVHLELVSSRENSLRGNHPLFVLHKRMIETGRCRKGHNLTIAENVYQRKGGIIRCAVCARQDVRNSRTRKREGKCAV